MGISEKFVAPSFDVESYTEKELVVEALRVLRDLEKGDRLVNLNAYYFHAGINDISENFPVCGTYMCALGHLWHDNTGRNHSGPAWDEFEESIPELVYVGLFGPVWCSGTLQDRIAWAEGYLDMFRD